MQVIEQLSLMLLIIAFAVYFWVEKIKRASTMVKLCCAINCKNTLNEEARQKGVNFIDFQCRKVELHVSVPSIGKILLQATVHAFLASVYW